MDKSSDFNSSLFFLICSCQCLCLLCSAMKESSQKESKQTAGAFNLKACDTFVNETGEQASQNWGIDGNCFSTCLGSSGCELGGFSNGELRYQPGC